jgi:hypothetical protein
MSEALQLWLTQATSQLSRDSSDRVKTEIEEHYEAALSDGATDAEADRMAVMALGRAKAANRQYRKVLLTSAEVRLLGESNWLKGACARPWLKWLFLLPVVIVMAAAAGSLIDGNIERAQGLLLGGFALGVWLAAPFLPVYTPWRGRAFRFVRWVALAASLASTMHWSWLWISCLWPVVQFELTRFSIRRKIPVGDWPKQLYL